MLLVLYLFVSIVPALYTWWRFAGWFAWTKAERDISHRRDRYRYLYHDKSKNDAFEPSTDIWIGAYTLGFLVGLAWPVALTLHLVSKKHGSLSYTPPAIREQKLRQRIRELERDVL